MRARIRLVLLGCALVALAGCGRSSSHPSTSTGAATSPRAGGAGNSATSTSRSTAGSSTSAGGGGATGTTSGATTATTSTPGTAAAPTSGGGQGKSTEQVTIRPVAADGSPAPGFTTTDEPSASIACSEPGTAGASLVAVDDDIRQCFPTAEYAVACWKTMTPGVAACFRDPWKKTVVRLASDMLQPVAKRANPRPLGLELADGAHCQIRNGGAWPPLAGHPDWAGVYSCSSGEALWAPESQTGIDTTSPTWTVEAAAMTGAQTLRKVGVVRAYFVGTFVN